VLRRLELADADARSDRHHHCPFLGTGQNLGHLVSHALGGQQTSRDR
jgi:hypothetical protein